MDQSAPTLRTPPHAAFANGTARQAYKRPSRIAVAAKEAVSVGSERVSIWANARFCPV